MAGGGSDRMRCQSATAVRGRGYAAFFSVVRTAYAGASRQALEEALKGGNFPALASREAGLNALPKRHSSAWARVRGIFVLLFELPMRGLYATTMLSPRAGKYCVLHLFSGKAL